MRRRPDLRAGERPHPVTLTDARLWNEFTEIRDRGFDRAAAISAVVHNHARDALHASAMAVRVTAIVERREAEWIAGR